MMTGGCEPFEVSFRWRPQLADSNDEMVLEAAANGRANAFNQPAIGLKKGTVLKSFSFAVTTMQ